MTGSIEPYYYPRKRDGVFKRTLCIVPNVLAVVSSSVGSIRDKTANVLFRDKNTVSAFEREFNEYLSLCKPLMRIFTTKDEKEYFAVLLGADLEQRDSIIMTESLSVLTMPESVTSSIVAREVCIKQSLYEYQKKRIELFRKTIISNSFTEIISLYDIETVMNGGVKVSLSDTMIGDAVFYTAEEYIRHLENLVSLLDTYENFHVKIIVDESDYPYMVYVKEDFVTLIAKTTVPPVVLAIAENNMNAAFWDYLTSIIGSENSGLRGRDETRKKLTEYIGRLKENVVFAKEAPAV